MPILVRLAASARRVLMPRWVQCVGYAVRSFLVHGPRRGMRSLRAYGHLRRSGLVDARWYRSAYPDVRLRGVDPTLHYLAHGAREGRDPSATFSTRAYLEARPDVAASGENPLVHFLLDGARSGPWISRSSGEAAAAATGRNPFHDPVAPVVSIVVVSLDSAATTLECVESLLKHTTGRRFEIVVVDNGSSADEAATLAAGLRGARLITLPVNRFLGEGNNIGFEAAKGEIVAFLGNDTLATPGWLEPLVECLDEDATIGAVGPMLVCPDGRLQEAGATVDADGVVVQRGKLGGSGRARHAVARDVDYCPASALVMRRQTFERVGGFDLMYEPAYCADVDLCLKVKVLGLRIRSCPASRIVRVKSRPPRDPVQGMAADDAVEINRRRLLGRWRAYLQTRDRTRAPPGPWAQPRRAEQHAAARRRAALFTPYPLVPGGGERYLLTIAALLLRHMDVTLLTPGRYSRLRIGGIARELRIDLDGLELSTLGEVRGRDGFDLFLALGNTALPPCGGLAKHNIYICQFPFPATDQVLGGLRRFLPDYERLVVYSPFVYRHMRDALDRLGVQSPTIDILAPPVDILRPLAKGDGSAARPHRIIGVGRFFAGGHCKRHDVMVDAFAALSGGLEQAVELHLAGAVHPEPEHRRYFADLVARSRGLPVHFHPNVSAADLARLYGEASVYWHATGFEIDEAVTPEKCEHFGISVVEAMSAGCIPVVVGRGGPAALVADGTTGFHVGDSVDAFVERTRQVIDGEGTRATSAMREAAIRAAADYAVERFGERLERLLRIHPIA